MNIGALGIAGALLVVAAGQAAAQVDTTVRKAPVLQHVSPALLHEITRYAPDTARRGPQLPARILIRRPVWVKDSLVAARFAGPATAPQQTPALQLRYRPVVPLKAVALTPAADSALQRQASPDWRLRSLAISRLGRLQPQAVHPRVVAALITQLDSIGVNRVNRLPALPSSATAGDREDYGEYVLTLSRAVVRLHDPRAVRAVATASLGTSQEAQRFVAAQGTASLPILDTTFALNGDASDAVIATWAYMLAASPSTLGAADSVFVYGRILLSRYAHPIPFLYAVRIAQLFELEPFVDTLSRDSSGAIAGAARLAARDLERSAAGAHAAAWATRLRLYAGHVCAGTLDARRAACADLLASANQAAAAIRTPAGRPRLAALLGRVAGDAAALLQTQGITRTDQQMLLRLAHGVGTAAP